MKQNNEESFRIHETNKSTKQMVVMKIIHIVLNVDLQMLTLFSFFFLFSYRVGQIEFQGMTK